MKIKTISIIPLLILLAAIHPASAAPYTDDLSNWDILTPRGESNGDYDAHQGKPNFSIQISIRNTSPTMLFRQLFSRPTDGVAKLLTSFELKIGAAKPITIAGWQLGQGRSTTNAGDSQNSDINFFDYPENEVESISGGVKPLITNSTGLGEFFAGANLFGDVRIGAGYRVRF